MSETTTSPSGSTTSSDPKMAMPQREKYWSELNDGEKIERLRSIVKSMSYQNNESRNKVFQLESYFNTHQHDTHGKIVVSLDSVRHGGYSLSSVGSSKLIGGIAQNDNEVFF